jgi:MOSC domain-containing protein YiiM
VIEIVAVSVGVPTVLASVGDERVWSAISKQLVPATERLWLSEVNLSGDGQADLSVHGGVDKAVYVYPSEHLASWTDELGETLGTAAFGENVTTLGPLEHDTHIGDVWSWGGALVQVCQPRSPCFKLALFRQRADIQARFRAAGRTGWYLRVLQPGEVPAAGPIEIVRTDPARVSVADAHRAWNDRHLSDLENVERVAHHPLLAEQWRASIVDRLERSGRTGEVTID